MIRDNSSKACNEKLDKLCKPDSINNPDTKKKLWQLSYKKKLRIPDFKTKNEEMCKILREECDKKISFEDHFVGRLRNTDIYTQNIPFGMDKSNYDLISKCYLDYKPSNSYFKEKYMIDKLKVISLTLFRPKANRNQRAIDYFSGALAYAQNANKVFKGYIVRIYIDYSILSTKYSETEKIWKPLLNQLQKHDNVQIVKYYCPLFSVTEEGFHYMYISSMLRILSLFDPDVGISVFRDIDSIPFPEDYRIIQLFESSKYSIHKYKKALYRPYWLEDVGFSKEELQKYGFFPAGLFAYKGTLDHEYIDYIYKIITTQELNWAFGIDEVLINKLMFKKIRLTDDNIMITQLHDIYSTYKTLENNDDCNADFIKYYGITKVPNIYVKDYIGHRLATFFFGSRDKNFQKEIYNVTNILMKYSDNLYFERLLLTSDVFKKQSDQKFDKDDKEEIKSIIADLLRCIPWFHVPENLELIYKDIYVLKYMTKVLKEMIKSNKYSWNLKIDELYSPQIAIHLSAIGIFRNGQGELLDIYKDNIDMSSFETEMDNLQKLSFMNPIQPSKRSLKQQTIQPSIQSPKQQFKQQFKQLSIQPSIQSPKRPSRQQSKQPSKQQSRQSTRQSPKQSPRQSLKRFKNHISKIEEQIIRRGRRNRKQSKKK